MAQDFRPLPGRTGDLDQGRLGHVARSIRRWGSRKYLLASLDQSLKRMGLDYVDIFYSHRFDPETPLEETMGALDTAVRQGKALYVGSAPTRRDRTREAVEILRGLGTPLLIHQPSYSMLNRWIEDDLLDVSGAEGVGCIAFSPLAQGLLSDRYLDGIPEDSRGAPGRLVRPADSRTRTWQRVRALNEIASRRGQSLAQMAIAWTLRDPRVTSALVGVSSVEQLDDNLDALKNARLQRRRSSPRSIATPRTATSTSGRSRAR